jgi:hypothetical protein
MALIKSKAGPVPSASLLRRVSRRHRSTSGSPYAANRLAVLARLALLVGHTLFEVEAFVLTLLSRHVSRWIHPHRCLLTETRSMERQVRPRV